MVRPTTASRRTSSVLDGRLSRSARRNAAGIASVVLLLSGVAAACGDDSSSGSTTEKKGSTTTTTAASNSAAGLAGTSWVLTTPVDSTEPTLDFARGGTVSGSTGCNRFTGTYTQDGDKLTLDIGPMTQMACTSTAANQQEQTIVAALPEVASADRVEQSLTLLDSSGKELLSYSAVSGELAGTSWKVTGVNTGSAVESSALTEALTLEFGTDGSVSGQGGCNNFNGTYTQDGETITFSEFASSQRACADDVTQLEDKYLAALAAASKVERSGTSLTLRDDAGAMQVTATTAS